jgi:peptidoglycan/LPS O-acetylase OafA/YrhL
VLAPAAPSRLGRFIALELLDNRYPALHGLRVIAILSVIQIHVTWIFTMIDLGIDRAVRDVGVSVFYGMDLFFILSGFLIGSILFHSIDTVGKSQLGRFYVRRIFRTFPSYWIVLTVLASTHVPTDAQQKHLIYEYAYLTNFLPINVHDLTMLWGWSLAFEEQFYLVAPLFLFVLVRLRSDRGRVALLVGLCLAALAVRLGIWLALRPLPEGEFHNAIYFRAYTRFDTLAAGILLAFVHRRWKAELTAWLRDPFHRALLGVPAMLCLWLITFPGMFGHEHLQLVEVFAWGTLTCLMYFPVLLLLLHTDGPIQRFLSAPLFRRLATLGYGVYLVHIPVVDEVILPAVRALEARHVPREAIWLGAIFGTMGVSLTIAYMMHVLIEKPALRLRDRLAA